MTAFVPYVTFMKHAKKVATARVGRTRPILSTVLHRDDYVAVTDSHRMYKATGLYEGEEKTLDAQTGQEVSRGKYPEIDRIILDKDSAKYTHEVDALKAYEAVRAIEIASKINKATDLMEIKAGYDYLEFTTQDKAAFDVNYAVGASTTRGILETVTLNIKYVKEALHVLKDAKAETFTLLYFGVNKPIQIVSGNFTAIVMPIRTPQEVPTGRVITDKGGR